MDTKSPACAAEFSAAKRCSIVLVLAILCGGCKSPPQNPFLRADKQKEASADDPATKTAQELADEVEAAFGATARDVREAAAETLADATDRGRKVGAQAAATAQNVATAAQATVQVQAIESLATWPLEQAGPLLLLAIAEGGPVARRAAARQLAERWPAAADFPVEAAAQDRAAAWAELRKLWVGQYGEINDAVIAAKAHAQQVLDETQEVVADAQQVVKDARQVARSAADGAQAVQDLVASLRQANLPEVARREASATLERLAQDAHWEVRRRVARAMGEIADPAFLPVLMAMLADQVEVQREALASLALVVDGDADAPRDAASQSTEEQIHRWQLWYQEHPNARTARH